MSRARLIPLILISILAGVYALDGFLTIGSQREILAQDEGRDALIAARAIAAAAAEQWAHAGADGARVLIERVSQRNDWISADWIDTGSLDGAPELSAAVRAALAAGEDHLTVGPGGIGERQVEVLAPVRFDGATVGAVALVAPIEATPGLARATMLRAAVSATASVLAVIAAFVLGWRFARRPSREMVEQARRVVSRAASGAAAARRQDDIAELGRALDMLSGEIDRAHQQLETETSARLATLEQLRHANRLKTVGQLTSGILHELGTPLTIIAGRARMVADGEIEGAEARESARIAVEQTERITKLVRGILDYARHGNRSDERRDLGALARDTLRLMAPMALKRGVTLRWSGDENPARGCFDTSLLQQVLTNLVLNAVQASPTGGEVRVGLDRVEAPPPAPSDAPPRPFLALHVSDSGAGIAEAEMTRIFEAFYTTKSAGEGTGLGLSISQQIVADYGGWIEVCSEPGRGSRFTVHLPRAKEAE